MGLCSNFAIAIPGPPPPIDILDAISPCMLHLAVSGLPVLIKTESPSVMQAIRPRTRKGLLLALKRGLCDSIHCRRGSSARPHSR